jgi:1-deoxy-D-xylulose-5-phosphate reductoisomerase
LSAANEVAVGAFLDGTLPYTALAETIAAALDAIPAKSVESLDDVIAADRDTRRWIREHRTAATRSHGR